MRIAFATRDGEHVGGQLRRAPRVAVYDVTAEGWQLARMCCFDPVAHRSHHRIQAIAGAAIVFVGAIGPSLAARLAAIGVRAATAREGTPIRELLAATQESLVQPGARPRS